MVGLWVGRKTDINRLNNHITYLMKNFFITLIAIILFTSCQKENKLSDKEIAQYISKGKEIGKVTVQKLGGNLMKHMKSGGIKEAIPFCNTNANNLTNEIANKYHVSIKRTSHKLRNEANKPNKEEKIVLERYLAQIKNGEQLKPKIEKDKNGKVHFYAPMKLQGKCLACHGDIANTSTDSIIKSLYPNDKAIGFKNGDFRGVLSVTFNE